MIADIAEEAGVPRKFLEQILLELRKRGLLRSLRGRSGGYLLAKAPRDISFADIIRATDGPLALAPCVSVTAYHRCEDCADESTCAIRRGSSLGAGGHSRGAGVTNPRRRGLAPTSLCAKRLKDMGQTPIRGILLNLY